MGGITRGNQIFFYWMKRLIEISFILGFHALVCMEKCRLKKSREESEALLTC